VSVDGAGVLAYTFTLPVSIPNDFHTRWTVTMIPRATSGGGVIKQGEESDASNEAIPFGDPVAPTVTLIKQQGTVPMGDGTKRIQLQYLLTPGDANGNDPSLNQYIVTTADGTFPVNSSTLKVSVLVPYGGGPVLTQQRTGASGPISTVRSTPSGELVWADPVTRMYYLNALEDNTLMCSAKSAAANKISGNGDGVSNAPGPGTNYTYDFSTLPGMVSGTVVTLKCGPPQDTAMYTITTRIP
jgi:hypothetical protein